MVTFVNKAEAMATVEAFTSAWAARDIDRSAAFFTDDFVLWNNGTQVEISKTVAVKFMRWAAALMQNSSYYNIRRHATPTGVVQQCLLSFDTDQGSFRGIPMLLIYTLRGDKISRCEEYLDNTGMPKLEWPEDTDLL